MSSRGENLLTRSTSEIGTLSEPRFTHHQLGLSSGVCAHWRLTLKSVPRFPSTAFQDQPKQQVLLCFVGFWKARFSTHVIYGDKAHINMFFWMKHESSLRLILILVSNFCEAAPPGLKELIARSVFRISSQTDRQIHKSPVLACTQIQVHRGGGPEQRFWH